MKYLLDGEQMRKVDQYSIETVGIPSVVLMERAALAVFESMKVKVGKKDRVLIVCGTGNNGGDGAALARMLGGANIRAEVVLVGERSRASEELELQLSILEKLSGTKLLSGHDIDFSEYTVIVDALFGTGLHRDITGSYEAWVDQINASAATVISVDIPSGIHASTGAVMHKAVKADITVTFGYGKIGLFLYPGASYAGNVIVKDIGFPEEARRMAGNGVVLYDREDVPNLLPFRSPDSHKGTFGKVLVIAGNKNMCGAAYFSAKAALKTGAGLVRVLTCEENRTILQEKLPEAVLETVNRSKPDWQRIEEALDFADAIVFGPGMGVDDFTGALLLKVLLHPEIPIVLDADGINRLAGMLKEEAGLKERLKRRGQIVYTPHLLEMQRLSGDSAEKMREDRISYVREQAGRLGGVFILKDAKTVVSDGEQVYLNNSGNHGMATAGSGDVLAGMVGGLLAQKMSPWEAAKLGVFLHGLAGDAAREKTGAYAMTAEDILWGIGSVIRQAEPYQAAEDSC